MDDGKKVPQSLLLNLLTEKRFRYDTGEKNRGLLLKPGHSKLTTEAVNSEEKKSSIYALSKGGIGQYVCIVA